MKTKLNWKKRLFSFSYSIYDNDKQIGFIKSNFFSSKSTAELNDKKYEFKSGISIAGTNIIDASNNKVIGKISYEARRNKAFIEVNNEIFVWEYKNLWDTKWGIYDLKGLNILYNSSAPHAYLFNCKGEIETNGGNEIELLSGLYVNYKYKQSSKFLLLILALVLCGKFIKIYL